MSKIDRSRDDVRDDVVAGTVLDVSPPGLSEVVVDGTAVLGGSMTGGTVGSTPGVSFGAASHLRPLRPRLPPPLRPELPDCLKRSQTAATFDLSVQAWAG